MARTSDSPRYKLLMVGTDTEVFLRDRETKSPVPVIGLVGGTKHQPKPVPELGKGFFVQEDNVMLEYNVPPAKTKDQFVGNITKMNSYLDELVAKKGLVLDICSSMQFKPSQLSHPQAQEIGCEPDWDVWKRLINPSPKEHPSMKTIRTSGGHLHMSFTVDGKQTEDIFLKEPLVKACDLTLGLPALVLDPDMRRRELYGKPGAFRNKDYGIEYRTLSNFWTKSPELVEWAFDGIVKAFVICNKHQQMLDNVSGHIRDCFSYSTTKRDKCREYVSYLMTEFNMLDRVPGIAAYPSTHAKIAW